MYDFLYKLVNLVIPRIRDFRGFSYDSFDKYGNFNIGIKENIIFPEIVYDKIDNIYGLDINFKISSNITDNNLLLLQELNIPIMERV